MSDLERKDLATMKQVAQILGDIGTVAATVAVGHMAAVEAYDALKEKLREISNKLNRAEQELDNIDPRELDNEMRSEPDDETEEKGDVLQFPDMGQIQMINALINDAEGIDDPNGTIAVALHDSLYRAERLAMDRGEDLLGSIERWIRVLNAASTGPDCPAETALNSGLYAGRDFYSKAAPLGDVKSAGAHSFYR